MHRALLAALLFLACLALYYIALIIINAFRHGYKARRLGCKSPPSLPSDPFGIRNMIGFLDADKHHRLPDYLVERFEVISRQQGRVVSTVTAASPPFRTEIFTVDPKNIQALLALQFKDFALGAYRKGSFKPLLGDGIFASDGKQWEHSRALLRPQFIREQVSDLSLEEKHVQTLIRVLNLHTQQDGWTDVVDLQALFFKLTLDSATEFLFGESVDSQLEGLPGAQPSKRADFDFAYVFDRVLQLLAFSSHFGPYYRIGHTREFFKLCAQVHSYVDYFVQMALDQETDNGKEKPQHEKYVFLRALAKQTRDPYELRSQLLNILLAGRDTTASLLGWFFFTLGKQEHEPMFTKLRAVILETFGTYDNPKTITFAGLKGCHYLQWCLNETLRLYPVVPLNVRMAQVDTTLPRGGGPDGNSPVYIPKGQEVAYSVHVMHRRRDLWGPDAHLFRPERWEFRRPGWEYLPFNGGPRICIGQQFALTEASYVVVRMMQRFDKIDGKYLGEVKHGLTLTNCPEAGVKVRLRRAEEESDRSPSGMGRMWRIEEEGKSE